MASIDQFKAQLLGGGPEPTVLEFLYQGLATRLSSYASQRKYRKTLA